MTAGGGDGTGRAAAFAALTAAPWDVVVVGGGITGAAVLRQAARVGLRALLVEARDFAWGTSSRSTKLVHGGLRYLASLQLGMVRTSVRERERLLQEGVGLVVPLPFLLAQGPGRSVGRAGERAGMALYDVLGGRLPRAPLPQEAVHAAMPELAAPAGLRGLPYDEAWVDDARFVLRVVREAVEGGATALNYVRAGALLREGGRVAGVTLEDGVTGRVVEVRARAVVNATGVWADGLRAQVGGAPRVRPLRGSHLVLAGARVPLRQGVAFRHPRDRRYVCALPWEGAVVLGTTDLDHTEALDLEPRITTAEADYLLEAARHAFPARGLGPADVLSTYAGVRPVLSHGADDPSREGREHLVVREEGLLTVTGGKLTTARAIAHDALRALRPVLPSLRALPGDAPLLAHPPVLLEPRLSPALRTRLAGRHGAAAGALLQDASDAELLPVTGTSTLWAELRWAARHEAVQHLDDLLLRRVRLGLLLPRGGEAVLPQVRTLCQAELGWSDARWEVEEHRYLELWRSHHGMPGLEETGARKSAALGA